MAKKSVTSLDVDERETLSRLGSKLPKGLDRQDRAAKVPAGASKGSDPKVTKLKKAVSEDYFGKNGQSELRSGKSNFTKKD